MLSFGTREHRFHASRRSVGALGSIGAAEVALANRQWQIFPTETPTAGYAFVNLLGSYTFAGPHVTHMFGVNAFNLNDKLYRNHLSFIKEFAPEIGRGVRFSYTLNFY
jgi:iron complex outermembrane receptor protein